jgi:hypothetical protein
VEKPRATTYTLGRPPEAAGSMSYRPLAAAFVLLLAQPTRSVDPLHGSLARSEPQAIYATNAGDAWNQVFFLLFTRTIPSRVVAPGSPVAAAGDERLKMTDERVLRIESGDRAIDPLYPSWLWMGSAHFDFARDNTWRVLREPSYSRLVAALEGVRSTASSRTPLARALMQADLWSAYDMLHTAVSPRPGPRAADGAERELRAATLLPLIATTMRALALSEKEIAALPDTYSAAAKKLALADLFGGQSEWMEIRWMPRRSHDTAAGHRRAARVFVRPAKRPADERAFLNQFRQGQGDTFGALDSVALVIQLLLIRNDGTVVPSPITYEAQFRGAAARVKGVERPQYELSRRLLLSSPSTGGLVGLEANAPAYLPMAGNDFSFATPPRLDGDPVLASLSTRCAVCHGPGPGVGHLRTFSISKGSGRPVPDVDRLVSAENRHANDIAKRKMAFEDFKAIVRQW